MSRKNLNPKSLRRVKFIDQVCSTDESDNNHKSNKKVSPNPISEEQ